MDVRNKATKAPVWIKNDGFLNTVQKAMKIKVKSQIYSLYP